MDCVVCGGPQHVGPCSDSGEDFVDYEGTYLDEVDSSEDEDSDNDDN